MLSMEWTAAHGIYNTPLNVVSLLDVPQRCLTKVHSAPPGIAHRPALMPFPPFRVMPALVSTPPNLTTLTGVELVMLPLVPLKHPQKPQNAEITSKVIIIIIFLLQNLIFLSLFEKSTLNL